MATLTTQNMTATGLVPTYAAAAAGGDRFRPGPGVFLHVKNGHTAAQTVTVDSKRLSDYGTDVNLAVAVANASEAMIPVTSTRRYADDDGLGDITYSGVTALTIAVVKVPG